MKNFSMSCYGFQLPYKVLEIQKRMGLLEREYPECKNFKEMGAEIQREYRMKHLYEKQGDLEELAKDDFGDTYAEHLADLKRD